MKDLKKIYSDSISYNSNSLKKFDWGIVIPSPSYRLEGWKDVEIEGFGCFHISVCIPPEGMSYDAFKNLYEMELKHLLLSIKEDFESIP
jgi:hypothetical protein